MQIRLTEKKKHPNSQVAITTKTPLSVSSVEPYQVIKKKNAARFFSSSGFKNVAREGMYQEICWSKPQNVNAMDVSCLESRRETYHLFTLVIHSSISDDCVEQKRKRFFAVKKLSATINVFFFFFEEVKIRHSFNN